MAEVGVDVHGGGHGHGHSAPQGTAGAHGVADAGHDVSWYGSLAHHISPYFSYRNLGEKDDIFEKKLEGYSTFVPINWKNSHDNGDAGRKGSLTNKKGLWVSPEIITV
jgi:hypothetical protein